MLDAAVGGTLGNKKPDKALELFVVMAMNGYLWNTSRANSVKTTGLYGVDTVTALGAQLETLNGNVVGLASSSSASAMRRGTCGGGHTATNFPIVGGVMQMKQVDFVEEFIKTRK